MAKLKPLIADLVAANHILYRHGVVDGYGHVSVRHPANPERFLMAAAVSPGRVKASDILELDLDGKQTDGANRPTYSERFIHAEVYRARKDVNAVIHSHSPTVIPFSVTDVALRPIVHTASFLEIGVPVFNSRHVPEATSPLVNNPAVGKALVAKLAQNNVVLMRGHGATMVGKTIKHAVYRAVYAAQNAQIQSEALRLGEPTYLAQEESANYERYIDEVIHRPWNMWIREVAE